MCIFSHGGIFSSCKRVAELLFFKGSTFVCKQCVNSRLTLHEGDCESSKINDFMSVV